MNIQSAQRGLLVAGALLFLLGLLQGAAVSSFANPRMALSAHLTAVQSGMALMIAGIVWPAVDVPAGLKWLAEWTITLGMHALWGALTLSAMTGASESLPIAGAGYSASKPMETAVTVLIAGSSLAMTSGWAVVVVGLIRRPG